MNTTKEERKEKAIEYMKELEIYEPYIDGYKKNDEYVCYFNYYAGFWAWQDKELLEKVKQIEEEFDCTVYAITHEYTSFGECYDFLIVSDYKEEWDELLEKCDYKNYYAFAYVWNKTNEYCSEFGTICIDKCSGGIRRTT